MMSRTNIYSLLTKFTSANEDVQLFWPVHFAFKHHTQKGAVKIELNFLLCPSIWVSAVKRKGVDLQSHPKRVSKKCLSYDHQCALVCFVLPQNHTKTLSLLINFKHNFRISFLFWKKEENMWTGRVKKILKNCGSSIL